MNAPRPSLRGRCGRRQQMVNSHKGIAAFRELIAERPEEWMKRVLAARSKMDEQYESVESVRTLFFVLQHIVVNDSCGYEMRIILARVVAICAGSRSEVADGHAELARPLDLIQVVMLIWRNEKDGLPFFFRANRSQPNDVLL